MRYLPVRLLPVLVVAGLSACASTGAPPQPEMPKPVLEDARYAAVTDEPFNVPAVNLRQFAPEFRRRSLMIRPASSRAHWSSTRKTGSSIW